MDASFPSCSSDGHLGRSTLPVAEHWVGVSTFTIHMYLRQGVRCIERGRRLEIFKQYRVFELREGTGDPFAGLQLLDRGFWKFRSHFASQDGSTIVLELSSCTVLKLCCQGDGRKNYLVSQWWGPHAKRLPGYTKLTHARHMKCKIENLSDRQKRDPPRKVGANVVGQCRLFWGNR